MVDPLFIGIVIILLISIIIIIRITELIPYLYIYFNSKKDISITFPSDFGLESTSITFPVGERLQKAWFFPSRQEDAATILMIPDWITEKSLENSLKTSGVLHLMGYNVFLPIIHDIDESTRLLLKMNFSPRYFISTITQAYEYLISRDDLNKRKIAVYSDSFSTLIASTLVREQPIQAIVLENGPSSLGTLIAHRLRYNGFGISVIRRLIRIFMGLFLWKTRWDRHRSLSMLHSCPTFLISVYDHKHQPNHNIFRNFSAIYKPKQLWLENALLPSGGIRDTWPDEYYSQVKHFYDRWINNESAPEWHSEMKVKKSGKNEYITSLTISALPPQMEHIPLYLTLSNRKNLIHQERVWFLGAEQTYQFHIPFRSSFHSLLPFFNIERTKSKELPWRKLEAENALIHTVNTTVSLKLQDLMDYEERYFKTKDKILVDIAQDENELIPQS
jgi:hypothetical protein